MSSKLIIPVYHRPRKVLVLGGNGFIGAHTVRDILEHHQDTKITLVNRGRSWDWDKAEELEDKITSIHHNRKKPFSSCSEISQLTSTHWDAIIDFSGFEPPMVKDSVETFMYKTDLYIYISTDSVYEVCVSKTYSGPTREEELVRPGSSTERARLAEKDDYGEEKLQCEEIIGQYLYPNAQEEENDKCKYIILRLADVIGPRDGTDRFWMYILWVQLAIKTETNVHLPKKYKNKGLSFVYVADVSDLLQKLVFQVNPSSIFNQEYNLACSEKPTLAELVSDIQDSLKLESRHDLARYDDEDSQNVPQIYPSVERGPVDISKAKGLLSWCPTPWTQVVQKTVNFYVQLQGSPNFQEEKKSVYKDLREETSAFYERKHVRYVKRLLNID